MEQTFMVLDREAWIKLIKEADVPHMQSTYPIAILFIHCCLYLVFANITIPIILAFSLIPKMNVEPHNLGYIRLYFSASGFSK